MHTYTFEEGIVRVKFASESRRTSIFATIGLEERNRKKFFRDKIRRKELEVKLKSVAINGERGVI